MTWGEKSRIRKLHHGSLFPTVPYLLSWEVMVSVSGTPDSQTQTQTQMMNQVNIHIIALSVSQNRLTDVFSCTVGNHNVHLPILLGQGKGVNECY